MKGRALKHTPARAGTALGAGGPWRPAGPTIRHRSAWTTPMRAGLHALLAVPLVLAWPSPVRAAPAADRASAPGLPGAGSGLPSDPENCLSCHRFPGIARVEPESGELRLFFTSARMQARMEGPHSRLKCTDCHPRSEVGSVPHDPVTPVACDKECHLVSGTGNEVTFSHAQVQERIDLSVHGGDALDGLPFSPQLLRPGQSRCLYCHDEPVFRDPEKLVTSHRGMDAGARCETCHTDELPVDAGWYLRHTSSRLQPARPTRETAEVCGVCHSDEAVMERSGLHDAVASYFRSFHGKAGLHDKGETATCVDCHGTEWGDVHLMLGAEDPESPIHEDNLASTCRTVGCHPSAAPSMGKAAVHLRIDPRRRTAEYWFTAAFVLLNVGVLAQYFALVLLELLSALLRRPSPHQRQMVALARAVQAHPEGRELTTRMSVHQRFQHWVFVLFFVVLVLTGMPIKFAASERMHELSWLFGGIDTARVLHRVAGVGLIATFGYHLAYLALRWLREIRLLRAADPARGLLRTAVAVAWESPMMLRPQDIRDFRDLFLHLLGLRRQRPLHGRFHFTQKAEYLALFWGMATIGISGALLWGAGTASGLFGGRILNFAIIVHSYEAFLAFLSVSVLHMFAVVLSPQVFPLSRASLTGAMPPEEMAEGHEGHLLDVARKLGIELPPMPEPQRGARAFLRGTIRRTYAALVFVAVAMLCAWCLGWLGRQLLGIGPAPEEVRDVTRRLDASDLADTGRHGSRSGRHERGPLAHFHVIPAWFVQDAGNGCTASGCHEALPHGERKEDRAFLNMHTTFVDCAVCHLEERPEPGDVAWVALEDRKARPAPAILRLGTLLDSPLPADENARRAFDVLLRGLLGEAITESGGDPELERWLLQVETSRIDGKLYASFVSEIRRGLALHGHGEYGAKLGLPGRRFVLDQEGRRAARALAEAGGSQPAPEREQGLATIHRGYVRSEVQCTRCHAEDGGLVQFEDLGYPEPLARRLRSNAVVRQSEAVEAGETFYLPAILDGWPGGEPPTAGCSDAEPCPAEQPGDGPAPSMQLPAGRPDDPAAETSSRREVPR